ncbi:hypothetical protein UlMin_008410 [Ulmus minor]
MEDLKSAIRNHEGKQHVMAAALHLIKALVLSDLTDDVKKVLADLDSQLSAMVVITESKGGELSELEQRLKQAEAEIMNWKENQAMEWGSNPIEACKHLKVIDEIHSLIESLRSLEVGENEKLMELLQRAESLLQMAMLKLEEEMINILAQHKQYFEPEYMSFRSCGSDVTFRSCGSDVTYDESFVSLEEEPPEEASRRISTGSESDDYLVDLVHPNVIPQLKSIANLMFASNYGHEFCQAFISSRKEALDEYWAILRMETFSIEDVLKMEWKRLNYEIKRWIWSMKIIIRVYLPSERRLCDQILGEFGSVSPHCFIKTSKSTMEYLLNFGEAVAMGSPQPEKLIRLLDMYEVLADLLLEIDALLLDDSGCGIRIEFHQLLANLGDCSRATCAAFRHVIASNKSTTPFTGGSTHPCTKYVMNYIKTLVEYADTFNTLLKDEQSEHPNSVFEPEDEASSTRCPMACHLRAIASILETNLNNRSKLYKDGALQHVFLMNNIHYIVEKVKGSKLRAFFGDSWIRENIVKVQQHATGYVRDSWSYALSFVKSNGTSTPLPKASFKERCRRFSVVFEEVYRNQTGWIILDQQLRKDLQISISKNVIQAYRNFTSRNSDNEKHIKYSADDLETYLEDLFGGSPRSLHYTRKK